MPRKTEGVYLLVQDVLQTFSEPYSEDVIEEVCLAIVQNPEWYSRYEELSADLRDWVVHNWIGRYTKQVTGLNTGREVPAQPGNFIKSYTKLVP